MPLLQGSIYPPARIIRCVVEVTKVCLVEQLLWFLGGQEALTTVMTHPCLRAPNINNPKQGPIGTMFINSRFDLLHSRSQARRQPTISISRAQKKYGSIH